MKPDCNRCPLQAYWLEKGEFAPVESTIRFPKTILVLGDSPSKRSVTYNLPFSGPEGNALVEALGDKVWERGSFTNIVACRYPNDNPKEFLAKLKKENRKRVRNGLEPMPTPAACCKPRLNADIDRHPYVLTLGSSAAKTVLPGNPGLAGVRGGPTYVGDVKVLPTLHPREVLRNPQWKGTFVSDVGKAFRFFRGALRWEDPEVNYHPSAQDLRAFFDATKSLPKKERILTYDVETDALEPLTAGLRCIGLGTAKKVLIIPLLSVSGDAEFYGEEEKTRILDLLRGVFENTDILKVGHNAGYYDRIVIEQHLGVTPSPLLDTILLHKLARSEFPHGLGYIGSVETDVPAWKSEHTATTAQDDRELHSYCATDVAVTHRIVAPLLHQAKSRNQIHLYDMDRKLQSLCTGMHRLGIRIDDSKRAKYERELTRDAQEWKQQFQQIAGELNPNSHDQVRSLLFDRWELPPHDFTSSGEPSTDASTLRFLLGNPSLDAQQRDAVDALRRYRKSSKLLNTYIKKLAPGTGIVDSDSFIYPDYNAHGTISGRFSSSNPNFQNIPYSLRDMFVPAKGMVFVGADFDQLELRFAAALSGARHYLDAFEKREIDPHNLTGDLMFGQRFWETPGAPEKRIDKGRGQFKRLRDLAKTICFSSLYGASPPKVHEILMKAEDSDGNLLYAGHTLRDVRALHRRWLRAAPEFKLWWDRELDNFRRDGYVEEPILGRRRYFYEEDFNAIVNFPVQAGGFAIVAQGMLDMVRHIPFDFRKREGLVNQLHDAVLVQVKEAKAEHVCEVITKSLTRKVPGLPVTFTAEAEVGYSWAEV